MMKDTIVIKMFHENNYHMPLFYTYPLFIVDHVEFRNFVTSLQPMFKIISRNTIKNDVLNFFDNLKSKTAKLLDKVTSRVAIITDVDFKWQQERIYGYKWAFY